MSDVLGSPGYLGALGPFLTTPSSGGVVSSGGSSCSTAAAAPPSGGLYPRVRYHSIIVELEQEPQQPDPEDEEEDGEEESSQSGSTSSIGDKSKISSDSFSLSVSSSTPSCSDKPSEGVSRGGGGHEERERESSPVRGKYTTRRVVDNNLRNFTSGLTTYVEKDMDSDNLDNTNGNFIENNQSLSMVKPIPCNKSILKQNVQNMNGVIRRSNRFLARDDRSSNNKNILDIGLCEFEPEIIMRQHVGDARRWRSLVNGVGDLPSINTLRRNGIVPHPTSEASVSFGTSSSQLSHSHGTPAALVSPGRCVAPGSSSQLRSSDVEGGPTNRTSNSISVNPFGASKPTTTDYVLWSGGSGLNQPSVSKVHPKATAPRPRDAKLFPAAPIKAMSEQENQPTLDPFGGDEGSEFEYKKYMRLLRSNSFGSIGDLYGGTPLLAPLVVNGNQASANSNNNLSSSILANHLRSTLSTFTPSSFLIRLAQQNIENSYGNYKAAAAAASGNKPKCANSNGTAVNDIGLSTAFERKRAVRNKNSARNGFTSKSNNINSGLASRVLFRTVTDIDIGDGGSEETNDSHRTPNEPQGGNNTNRENTCRGRSAGGEVSSAQLSETNRHVRGSSKHVPRRNSIAFSGNWSDLGSTNARDWLYSRSGLSNSVFSPFDSEADLLPFSQRGVAEPVNNDPAEKRNPSGFTTDNLCMGSKANSNETSSNKQLQEINSSSGPIPYENWRKICSNNNGKSGENAAKKKERSRDTVPIKFNDADQNIKENLRGLNAAANNDENVRDFKTLTDNIYKLVENGNETSETTSGGDVTDAIFKVCDDANFGSSILRNSLRARRRNSISGTTNLSSRSGYDFQNTLYEDLGNAAPDKFIFGGRRNCRILSSSSSSGDTIPSPNGYAGGHLRGIGENIVGLKNSYNTTTPDNGKRNSYSDNQSMEKVSVGSIGTTPDLLQDIDQNMCRNKSAFESDLGARERKRLHRLLNTNRETLSQIGSVRLLRGSEFLPIFIENDFENQETRDPNMYTESSEKCHENENQSLVVENNCRIVEEAKKNSPQKIDRFEKSEETENYNRERREGNYQNNKNVGHLMNTAPLTLPAMSDNSRVKVNHSFGLKNFQNSLQNANGQENQSSKNAKGACPVDGDNQTHKAFPGRKVSRRMTTTSLVRPALQKFVALGAQRLLRKPENNQFHKMLFACPENEKLLPSSAEKVNRKTDDTSSLFKDVADADNKNALRNQMDESSGLFSSSPSRNLVHYGSDTNLFKDPEGYAMGIHDDKGSNISVGSSSNSSCLSVGQQKMPVDLEFLRQTPLPPSLDQVEPLKIADAISSDDGRGAPPLVQRPPRRNKATSSYSSKKAKQNRNRFITVSNGLPPGGDVLLQNGYEAAQVRSPIDSNRHGGGGDLRSHHQQPQQQRSGSVPRYIVDHATSLRDGGTCVDSDVESSGSKRSSRDKSSSSSSNVKRKLMNKVRNRIKNGAGRGGSNGRVFGLLDAARSVLEGGVSEESEHGLITIRIQPATSGKFEGKFGFNVKGGADQDAPVLVSKVTASSPADICYPRLNEGDQVLLINGREVSTMTHVQVVNSIKASRECHSGELVLTVRQNVYEGGEGNDEPEFRYVPESVQQLTVQAGGAGVPLPVTPAASSPQQLKESIELLQDGLASGSLVGKFEILCRRKPGLSMDAARLPRNETRNRYRDISPYDTTRVILLNTDPSTPSTTTPTSTTAAGACSLNDYINASHVVLEIPGSNITNRYIACQGPLNSTCGHFWQMVWEQQSTLLVMLTTCIEQGRSKCHQYWPDVNSSADYGVLTISCNQQKLKPGYAVKELTVTHRKSGERRQLQHLQYLSWPDHGVPEHSTDFLTFVKQVRDIRADGASAHPTIVHCSAGIGRTGVLMLMETAQCLIEAQQPVYPLDLVQTMRDQRAMMIQTSGQFRFVCEAICRVYNEKLVEPLSKYSNR